MAENSKIEWTHHTFNPWRGCTKVSQGCKHCYAETMSGRNPGTLGVWGPQGTRVVAAEGYWRQPLKWDKAAAEAGERHRVFCASLADVFEGPETMPAEAWVDVIEARARLMVLIAKTPHLDWLLLTKRPQNIGRMVPPSWYANGFPSNVWIGTSVEDQAAADERIPHLIEVPARVRFLSCEPLLGPVDLRDFIGWHPSDIPDDSLIHWVIAGGESGANARPMHPEWARSLRDQCQDAGVAFFFKQWGEYAGQMRDARKVDIHTGEGPITWLDYDDATTPHAYRRVGKKAAGRLLDGVEHNELPL
jgi:protein gp37